MPSNRAIRRPLVTAVVADIHHRSRGTYGMLRIRAAPMREQDMVVNKKLILSIMRERGIKGRPGSKKHKKNLVNQATEEDLVQHNFTMDRGCREFDCTARLRDPNGAAAPFQGSGACRFTNQLCHGVQLRDINCMTSDGHIHR